jgi:hypothetical protein
MTVARFLAELVCLGALVFLLVVVLPLVLG